MSIIPDEFQGALVLLVDDNEATRYIFGRWLRRAGFEVVEAANGAEALEHLEAAVPDIAVLDVNLPDMSGFRVLEHVKALDASIAVLHVSATHVEVSDRSEGLQRGADAYLTEPVERDELLSSVVALLRYSMARRAAERLTAQMASLHDGLMDMHAALTVEELTAVAARAAARTLHRQLAVVAYADRDGTIAIASPNGDLQLDVYRPRALEPATMSEYVVDVGVITSVVMDPFDPPPDLRPLLDPLAGGAAEAMVTRHARGAGVAGVLVGGRLSESSDRLLASQIVQSVAVAVDNLRLYEVERGVALTLQRALLPDSSFALPGVDIAAQYMASDEHSEVGGDFYDAFALDHEHVAVVIGDVQGHSLEAASVMGDLRAALRAYSIEGLSPGDVVERTNELFMRFAPTQSATLCLAVIDAAQGRATIVNAGHLPPLVATADGAWWLTGGGTLLGLRGQKPTETVFELPANASLLLVTDGLVEDRTRTVTEGLASLAAAVRAAPVGDVEAMSQYVLEQCRPPATQAPDDIAIIVVRLTDAAHGRREPSVAEGSQMTVAPAS